MASLPRHVVKHYSCRCRNITINAYDIAPSTEPNDNAEQALVEEDGIRIVHSYLTLRTRGLIRKSADKFVQHLNLHCLECKTKAYRVVQEIPPGLEAREGPISPNDGWVEQSIMISRTGWIEVLLGPDGCLAGTSAIETHFHNLTISNTFSIVIIPPVSSVSPTALFSTPPLQRQPTPDDTDQLAAPQDIPDLSQLPPLLPPPPFTPSHPVFQLLSAHATSKSSEWRVKVEEVVHNFLRLQLDDLKLREEVLRTEVDAIWKNYREAWKEVIARSNETRHERSTQSDVSSHGSKKSPIPISIRDFSPSIPSGTSVSSDNETAVSPPYASSPINRSRSVYGSFNIKCSPAQNEMNSTIDHTQLSSPGDRGELLMSAFRRNMDTNIDIATSLRWAEGEEAMRKRFETKNEDRRARKRTSKSLGITGIVNIDSDTSLDPSTSEQFETQTAEDPKATAKKQKRRVTFDTRPNGTSEPAATTNTSTSFIEELFDLDDFPPTDSSSVVKNPPVNRNPVYKMHHNSTKTESIETHVSSLPLFSNAFNALTPSEFSVNGARKGPNTISLLDALPLLSSSVPVNDHLITARTFSPVSRKTPLSTLTEHPLKDAGTETEGRTLIANSGDAVRDHQQQSIPQDATGELELRNLFAASAPSHRHAWKEGGSAWKILNRLNFQSLGPDSPSVEDDNEDPWDEAVSDTEDNVKQPTQLARSLPIGILPPFRSLFQLEPKTSLADKQGILVPPLKSTKQTTSSAIRKAVYAERDLSRFVDPGPTLGLSDPEEVEEEIPEVSDVDHQDRGRKHALSILQARSVVPEAGMWRSLAA